MVSNGAGTPKSGHSVTLPSSACMSGAYRRFGECADADLAIQQRCGECVLEAKLARKPGVWLWPIDVSLSRPCPSRQPGIWMEDGVGRLGATAKWIAARRKALGTSEVLSSQRASPADARAAGDHVTEKISYES